MATAPLTLARPVPQYRLTFGVRRLGRWLRTMEPLLCTWALEGIAAIGLWAMAQSLLSR